MYKYSNLLNSLSLQHCQLIKISDLNLIANGKFFVEYFYVVKFSTINLKKIFLYFSFQHDPEQCTPGGEDGNFIMFARATSGDKRNNNKFSPCSLKSIEPVLNAKARSSKGCFTGELTIKCEISLHS